MGPFKEVELIILITKQNKTIKVKSFNGHDAIRGIHLVVYTCGIFWAIASLGPKYTTSVSNPF